LLTFPLVLTVNYLGDPDNGMIITAYVGSFLLAGGYLAITSLTSAMTRNQVISFIISVVICLLLILAGYPPITDLLTSALPGSTWLVEMVSAMSVMTHFEAFQRGVLDTRDIVYFLSVIGFCLFSTGVIIRTIRAG
jgi:ABC-2 type transport system permease protein